MKMILRQALIGIAVAAALGLTTTANAQQPAKGRAFGDGNPFREDELPAGVLRDQLKALPAQAKTKAMERLNGIRFHSHDVPFMRADKEGGIFYADTFKPEVTATTGVLSAETLAAGFTAANVFKLHSKAGSSQVIYLDFDGHAITNTAWNSYVGATTLNALPYDLDGNPASFSDAEAANIAEIWRRIAEDYAPFNVDVTTELPASFGPTVGRILITQDADANGKAMPSQGAGGVAYVNVWGASNYHSYYSPALVYYDNLGGGRPDYVTEAASHEMGHNMGLSHDGTSTAGYYGGHGTGYTSWGPIMGTGYNRNVSQWSKGEYTDANQTQDDVSIIQGKVSLRTDDHGDQTGLATPLVVDAAGNVLVTTPVDDPANLQTANKGIISTRSDVDVFSFVTSGGTVTLQATPAREALNTRGGNLDTLLSLHDQYGTLVASSDPVDDTDAGVSTLLVAGKYYLSVQGVGNTYYSDYGSLGQYHIEGVIPQAVDKTAPTPNPMGWSVAPQAIDHTSIRMTALTATDDVSGVEYYFACTTGGNGCRDSGWVSSPTYTATGLDAATAYTFTVKVRDAAGNETAASGEASVSTLVAPVVNRPPLAVTDKVSVVVGNTVSIPVLANDSDPEGDALSIVAISKPSKGTASIAGSQISYKAGTRKATDSFTYTISDGHGNKASTTVTVTITAAARK